MNETQLAFFLEKIEAKLQELTAVKLEALNSSLFEAARYSLFSGGKRLRPLLAMASAVSFGADWSHAIAPASALELIHTYSLIHDDLPCMDNDDFRRGKPTLHKVYPEGHALLAGDFLLNYAFQVISEAPHLSIEQRLQLVTLLSKRGGADGMIGGQAVDLQSKGEKIDWETLQYMHLGKTAALLTASLEFGGIVAKLNEKNQHQLALIGNALGLAFQIVDDILDSQDSDVTHDKPTSVTLLGLAKAQTYAEELCNFAKQRLKMLPYPTELLELLFEKCVFRTI